MATTGTASFTITRDQLITAALRKLRVLQEGQTANAQQISDAAQIVNFVIKDLMSHGLYLWTYQLIQIPMVANKNFYTIGPVSADVISPRPLRLYDGSFIRDTVCDQDQDTPLRLLSRLDYLQFGNKVTQGIPNSIYWDAKIAIAGNLTSPSTGFGTLRVYTNPIDSTRVIYANFQRQVFDMSNGTDEFDFPAENFLMLQVNLAAWLADEYEVPEDRLNRVHQEAKYLREQLEDWSTEWAPMQFTPDWMMGQQP